MFYILAFNIACSYTLDMQIQFQFKMKLLRLTLCSFVRHMISIGL